MTPRKPARGIGDWPETERPRERLLSAGAESLSDAQLLARTWWLFVVAAIGMEVPIARDRPVAALALCTGVVLAFGPVNGWWLARLRAGLRPLPARTLLLLRVFGYTARTERLFDRIGARCQVLSRQQNSLMR